MTGTALAQDADPPADPATDPAATDPAATDPNAAPATEPAMEAPADGGKTKTIGADLAFLLPLGDFADAVDAAFGALGRFEFGLNPQLAITGRAGLLYALAKADGVTLLMIPVYGGVKYNIGTSGLFAHGEVGIVHSRVSVDGGGSDSNTKISFDAGAGYQKGKLQFRAGFWYTATDPASMGILASAGFNFASL